MQRCVLLFFVTSSDSTAKAVNDNFFVLVAIFYLKSRFFANVKIIFYENEARLHLVGWQ